MVLFPVKRLEFKDDARPVALTCHSLEECFKLKKAIG